MTDMTNTPEPAVVTSDVVEDFLHELSGWESAYPLAAFPEPDLKRAADLLKAGGMTLDAVSASNMRHVVSCIAPKARAAIAALDPAPAPRQSVDHDGLDAAGLAQFFHDTYESLAPRFGYLTRPDTKDFDPDTPNGRLMIAVCGRVIEQLSRPSQSVEKIVAWLRELSGNCKCEAANRYRDAEDDEAAEEWRVRGESYAFAADAIERGDYITPHSNPGGKA